jgi:hypothetical protein
MKLLYKISKFINNSLLRTPGLEYLKKHTSLEKRNDHINFWINRAKKNSNMNFFYFDQVCTLKKKIKFSSTKDFLITDEMYEALGENGILVIEDALPSIEIKKIKSYFDSLKKKNSEGNMWLENKKIVSRGKDTLVNIGIPSIENFPTLKFYSDQFTKKIYGKKVTPSVEMHFLKLINYFEKEKIRGETFFHSDRFLPHFKIFYSIDEIKDGEAPFEFCIGSHIVNRRYIDFFKYGKFFDETDGVSIHNYKIEKVTTKPNTLYLCFTNGLHRRSLFTKADTERSMVFLQYVKNYNKLDYLLN